MQESEQEVMSLLLLCVCVCFLMSLTIVFGTSTKRICPIINGARNFTRKNNRINFLLVKKFWGAILNLRATKVKLQKITYNL